MPSKSVPERKSEESAPFIDASSAPYIAPFLSFLAFLALRQFILHSDLVEQIVCLVAISLVSFIWSRKVVDLRLRHSVGTLAIGVGVFLLWIAPDRLIPGYREHWLFSNSLTGHVTAGISEGS